MLSKIKREMLVLSMLLLFVLPLVDPAGAAEKGVTVLDEYVVSAIKKESTLLETPASIAIITADDIERMQLHTVSEVLATLPSLIDNATGENHSYDFRGTKSSHAGGPKIMINNRKMLFGLYGNNIVESIPLSDVERIEVIKTSGSYIAGSDSTRGVINIILKDGAKLEKIFKVKASTSYGSWDTYRSSLSASGKSGKLDYYLGGFYKETEGYRKTYPEYKTLTGMAGYELTDNLRLSLTGGYNDGFYGGSGHMGLKKWQLDQYRRAEELPSSQTASSYLQKGTSKDFDVLSGSVGLDYDMDGCLVKLLLGGSSYDELYKYRKYENKPTSINKNYEYVRDQDTLDFQASVNKTFSGEDLVNTPVIGYDFSKEDYNQIKKYPYPGGSSKDSLIKKGTVDFEKKYHSIFASNELTYKEKFCLGAGIRQEWVDNEVSNKVPQRVKKNFKEFSWNIVPSYRFTPNTNLYFSVSDAYWYPIGTYFKTAMEKDIPGSDPAKFKPEEYFTYETGFKHRFADYLNYSIAFFQTEIKDRFVYRYNDAGQSEGWQNAGESTTRGVELEIDGKPFDWLGYRTSLSCLDAEWDRGKYRSYEWADDPADDTKKNLSLAGKKVYKVPSIQALIGFDIFPPMLKNLRLSTDFRYTGSQYIDHQNHYKQPRVWLTDTRLSYKLEDWKFHVSGTNIFDKKYETYSNSSSNRNDDGTPDHSYYPRNGRYVEMGATVTF